MTVINLTNVTKRFGDLLALRNLDLHVEENEIYGFLGPNGAGKSTTINTLLDFARPDGGEVSVLGHDAQQESDRVRERIGILPEGFDVYDRLTGRQHLEFTIESKNAADDPERILERVGISEAADRKAGGYSKGMAQRLMLGAALVGEPDLLILDEPSTGLDPNGAREMRRIVREERERGATVFFSSHILEQVDAVCDRVGILREGELVAEDTVAGLRETTTPGATLVVDVDRIPDGAVEEVRTVPGVSEVVSNGSRLTVTSDGDSKTAVLNTLDETGASVQDFTTEEASLEELFAAYTQDGSGREVEADRKRETETEGAQV